MCVDIIYAGRLYHVYPPDEMDSDWSVFPVFRTDKDTYTPDWFKLWKLKGDDVNIAIELAKSKMKENMWIRFITCADKEYLVSHKTDRTPNWIVTQDDLEITGTAKKAVVNQTKKIMKEEGLTPMKPEIPVGYDYVTPMGGGQLKKALSAPIPVECPSEVMTANDCYKAKAAIDIECASTFIPTYYMTTGSFGTSTSTTWSNTYDDLIKYVVPTQKQETKGTIMCYDDDCCGSTTPIDIRQKEYLDSRAYDTRYAKDRELERKFGLMDDLPPTTVKEVRERLLAGKWTLRGKDDARVYGEAPIRWRDPAIQEDRAGFDAAKKLLDKAFTDVKDAIMIKDAEAGLAAVKAFETATF